jgi:hypothetical protein
MIQKGVQTTEIDRAASIGHEVYLLPTRCDPQQDDLRVVFSCSNQADIAQAGR